jgi:hypothetical protein
MSVSRHSRNEGHGDGPQPPILHVKQAGQLVSHWRRVMRSSLIAERTSHRRPQAHRSFAVRPCVSPMETRASFLCLQMLRRAMRAWAGAAAGALAKRRVAAAFGAWAGAWRRRQADLMWMQSAASRRALHRRGKTHSKNLFSKLGDQYLLLSSPPWNAVPCRRNRAVTLKKRPGESARLRCGQRHCGARVLRGQWRERVPRLCVYLSKRGVAVRVRNRSVKSDKGFPHFLLQGSCHLASGGIRALCAAL